MATGAVLMWAIGLSDNPAPLPEPVTRFSQALPERAPLQVPTVPGSALAISRDGRQLIYGAGLLQLRRLSELTVRDVPETQGALNPFFSPDGEWVAFFTAEGMLKKVSLRGGRAVILARGLSSAMWLLGSWSDDGRIVFDGYTGGLRVVPAGGGAVTTLTKPSGEWHQDPQVLPGSDVVRYQAQALTRFRIEAISLDANRRIRKTILEEASRA